MNSLELLSQIRPASRRRSAGAPKARARVWARGVYAMAARPGASPGRECRLPRQPKGGSRSQVNLHLALSGSAKRLDHYLPLGPMAVREGFVTGPRTAP